MKVRNFCEIKKSIVILPVLYVIYEKRKSFESDASDSDVSFEIMKKN